MNFAISTADLAPLRRAISEAYRRDESACVQALLDAATLNDDQKAGAQTLARQFVETVRTQGGPSSGVAALMHEFSLSSEEGIALMCVAEALLRIPDRDTADRLIRDKLSAGDWETHLGQSASLFVNAAAWGLLITGKLVTPTRAEGLAAGLTRLLARGGEPLIRRGFDLAMRLLGRQFVLAENIEEALERAGERSERGYRYSFDMLGEAALTAADAERYYDAYEHAIHRVGTHGAGRGVHAAHGVSVKLSALHPRYARAQRERVLLELLPRLLALFELAHHYGIGLSIDAEEADRLELSLELIEAVASAQTLQGFQGVGIVVQAYQKRAPYVIDWLVDLARTRKCRFMLRLVKGAYWDSEIKRGQIDGASGYPVYTRKGHTDVAYLACARKLLEATDVMYPQFATHNAYSVAVIHELAMHAARGPAEFEFQCLHGMGEQLYDAVQAEIGERGACRIYAPVGSHQSLLPYLVRRLLE
ncbi:MAG TPA: proline dehydrogenase family protein, partial [Burkholderiales bacterium]|nr:proline dehydrogenase family protein [Burkholderiales bacterium]